MQFLIVLLLLSTANIEGNEDNCGENSCVFPFNFGGQIFTTCTSFGFDQLWCSTSNSEDGEMEEWKICGECEGVQVNDCQENSCAFPFTFGGQRFDSCTDFGYDKLWCSTLNDANGEMVKWKTCGECEGLGFGPPPCFPARTCIFPDPTKPTGPF